MKYKITLLLVWFLVGLMAFLWLSDYSQKEWINGYYVWDKGKDAVFLFALLHVRQFKMYILPAFIFSLIRLLWEVAAWIFGLNISDGKAVDILFVLCLVAYLVIGLKDLKVCQRLRVLYGLLTIWASRLREYLFGRTGGR